MWQKLSCEQICPCLNIQSRKTGSGHAADSKMRYTIQFSILVLCAKYQEAGLFGSTEICDRIFLRSRRRRRKMTEVIPISRFWDGRMDGQTDGVTELLYLLSPLARQVKIVKVISVSIVSPFTSSPSLKWRLVSEELEGLEGVVGALAETIPSPYSHPRTLPGTCIKESEAIILSYQSLVLWRHLKI